MNQDVKVSIVLPTYNGSRYIRQSIDSCLNQTYRNIELIVVDDCSTDNIAEIVKSYSDPRVRYVRNEKNQRLPQSLNIGFAQSQGEYVTWTSDDNIYAPEAIEKMLAFLMKHRHDFVFCDYYFFNDDDLNHPTLVQLPDKVAFHKINPVRACFLYTRKVKDAVGDYDPAMELAEDYEYWIRVSKKFKMHHYPKPLYYYRVHQAQLYTSRIWEVEVMKFLVRLKHDIANIHQVTLNLVALMAEKRRLFFVLNRTLIRVFFSRKIHDLLVSFKTNQADIKTIKSDILALMNTPQSDVFRLSWKRAPA
jgi:glycosyltransferase involved in cell wall biosynthesis